MGWNFLPAQSVMLDSLANDTEVFKKHYLYPSVLRALGGLQSESFNDLINDLEYIRILRLDSSFIASHDKLEKKWPTRLIEEGYESYGVMYEKGISNELFALEENDKIIGFIAYRKEKNSALIIEIVGSIDLSKLTELMNMDYSNFTTFID